MCCTVSNLQAWPSVYDRKQDETARAAIGYRKGGGRNESAAVYDGPPKDVNTTANQNEEELGDMLGNWLCFSSVSDVRKLAFGPSEAWVWCDFHPKVLQLHSQVGRFS